MTIVVCLDDRNGMAFNKRRQSSDCELRARLLSVVEGSRLWMNPYSAKQFTEEKAVICVADDVAEQAATGEYVFLETTDPMAFLGRATRLIVYRWNRVYPSDTTFPLEQFTNGTAPSHRFEFVGYSHEKITEEVYEL